MPFDLMDILTGRAEKVCTGKYFDKAPIITELKGDKATTTYTDAVVFEYEHLDPKSRTYRMLFGNLFGGQAWSATIKTNSNIDFKVNGYVRLQDGNIYTIVSVDRELQSASSQAFRYFKEPAGVEKVIRLTQVENPFELA